MIKDIFKSKPQLYFSNGGTFSIGSAELQALDVLMLGLGVLVNV